MAWYNDLWKYRKSITINPTSISGSHINFPVFVSMSKDSDLNNYAQANGNDILFISGNDFVKLAHQIITYQTGSLLAYVNVPTLNTSSTANFYMYFGNQATNNQQNSPAVWDTNFRGVWHLSESSGLNTFGDSTLSRSFSGGGAGQNPVSGTTGKIFKALSFTAASSQYANVSTTVGLAAGTSPRTLELWSNTNNVAGAYRWSVAFGNPWGSQAFFIGQNAATAFFGGYGDDITINDAVTASIWSHWALTYDGTYARGYKDGVLIGGPTAKSWNLIYGVGHLGRQVNDGQYDGQYWDGYVEGVRYSNSVRSVDWLWTEVYNVNSASLFLTLGSLEYAYEIKKIQFINKISGIYKIVM